MLVALPPFRWRTPNRLVALATGLPILLIAAGAAEAITDRISLVALPMSKLVEVLPIDATAPDLGFGLLSALGQLALVAGLLRGKRLAWHLALVIFTVSLLAHTLVVWEPTSAIVSFIALAALVVGRRRFDVDTGPAWRRCFVILVVAGLGLALADGVVGPGSIGVPGDLQLPATVATLAAAIGAGSDTALVRGSDIAFLAPAVVLSHVLLVLASLTILVAVPEPRTDDDTRRRARAILAAEGGDGLVPFQLGPDMHLFAPLHGSGGLAYGLVGRTAVILGDPFGPQVGRGDTLDAFVTESHPRDRIVALYQASSATRQMLSARGWRIFQIGDEAVIDLAAFNVSGSARANLRHTLARSTRAGIQVRWFPDGIRGDEQSRLRSELAAVDRAWRHGRGPELAFSIGRFSASDMEQVAAAVAVDDHDRAVAFTTFRSTGTGWVLDLTRRSADSPPGAVESCIVTAVGEFRATGALTLSLGLAPLASIGRPGSLQEERLLLFASHLTRRWYDVEGLRFFKAKFDPAWQPRYCAVRRRRHSVLLVVALLQLHVGGFGHAIAGLR